MKKNYPSPNVRKADEVTKFRLDNLILVVVRHGILSALGGWLVGKGLLTDVTWEIWLGASMSILSSAWALRCANKDKVADPRGRLKSFIRHTLTTVGGAAVGMGWIKEEEAAQYTGVLMTLAGSIWSYLSPEKVYKAQVLADKPGLLSLALLLPLLPSCSGFEGYRSEAEDFLGRTEVGVGFAYEDGWVYGPLKGRLKPLEEKILTREDLVLIPNTK